MINQKDIKAEILFRAEKLAHYNDLLIRQCNSWLTGEEGDENMMRKYKVRTKISSRLTGLPRFFIKIFSNSQSKSNYHVNKIFSTAKG